METNWKGLDPQRVQMMILLVVFILLLIVRYLNNNHWRDSLFETVIWWVSIIYIYIEVLSLKKQVNKRTLMLGCIAILIGEVVYIASILIKRKRVFSKARFNINLNFREKFRIQDIMIVGLY